MKIRNISTYRNENKPFYLFQSMNYKVYRVLSFAVQLSLRIIYFRVQFNLQYVFHQNLFLLSLILRNRTRFNPPERIQREEEKKTS